MFLIMFRKKNKNGNCQLFGKIIFFFFYFRRKIRIKNNKQSIIDLTQMPFVGPFVISLLVSSFWSSYAPFCYSIWHTFSSQQYDTVNIQWLLILKCFICCKSTSDQAVQVLNQPGSCRGLSSPQSQPNTCSSSSSQPGRAGTAQLTQHQPHSVPAHISLHPGSLWTAFRDFPAIVFWPDFIGFCKFFPKGYFKPILAITEMTRNVFSGMDASGERNHTIT